MIGPPAEFILDSGLFITGVMMQNLVLGIQSWSGLIIPVFICLVTFVFGLFIRKIVFVHLLAWAKGTKTDIDDIIVSAIKRPFLIWCLMLGLYLAFRISSLPENLVQLFTKILIVLGILSVTFVLADIAKGFIKIYAGKASLPITSLTQNISRIIIFSIGSLMILNSLGISITPILATLGVGGLAVALALQDTLSNLFAGVHIIFSRQIKVGDYVKMESGEEGYVTDINWRTTKIRMLQNNVILVPNDKLIKAVLTNYYLPEREMAVLVNLGVDYGSDLEKVEKITIKVGKEVMKQVSGGVPEFEPFIRYNNFGDFSINFTVILRGREFVDQYLIKHEFIKKLHTRYQQEGIVIPFPIRTIRYENEKKG
jgi:small-conductance mechanosensitive channel